MTLEELFNSESEDNRGKVMDFIDGYYTAPTDVKNVSDRMEDMLKFDSDYMTQAGDASEEIAKEAGMLESGFNRGTGYAEAIDRSAFVAQEDAYTDAFNAQMDNEKNWNQYQAAWKAAGEQQWFEGNLDYDKLMADYQTLSDESSREWEELYADKANQFNITLEHNRHLFDLEKLSKQNDYYTEQMDYVQALDLEARSVEFGYQRDLYGTQQQHATERTEESLGFFEQVSFANIQSIVGQGYLSTITELNLSDLYDTEKGEQMKALAGAINATTSKWKTNFPEFEHLANIHFDYDAGSELYKWNDADVRATWGKLSDVITDVDKSIHEETSRKERAGLPAYGDLEVIRDLFPAYMEKYPKAANKIMQWYDTVGKHGWNMENVEESYSYVLNSMRRLMQGMTHLDTGATKPDLIWNEDTSYLYDFDIDTKTVSATPFHKTSEWANDDPLYDLMTTQQYIDSQVEKCIADNEMNNPNMPNGCQALRVELEGNLRTAPPVKLLYSRAAIDALEVGTTQDEYNKFMQDSMNNDKLLGGG